MKYLRIGQISQKTGISVETIRYYEKQKLITPALRSDSGYRLYTKEAIQTIQFIFRAKEVGFSLKGISELLQLHHFREEKTCSEIKGVASEKLEEIENKLQELERMRETLQVIMKACCGGSESAENCSIFKAFDKPFFH